MELVCTVQSQFALRDSLAECLGKKKWDYCTDSRSQFSALSWCDELDLETGFHVGVYLRN